MKVNEMPEGAPECFGKEWHETACVDCACQTACTKVFASDGLDGAAKTLGALSPTAVAPSKLAEVLDTSEESIRRALALRVIPENRPASKPGPSSQPSEPESTQQAPTVIDVPSKPLPSPTESASLCPELVARSFGARSLKALKALGVSTVEQFLSLDPEKAKTVPGCGAKVVADLAAAQAALLTESRSEVEVSEEPVEYPPAEAPEDDENSGAGLVFNLTTGVIQHAEWPGFPPLFASPTGSPLLQAEFWLDPVQKWCWLVAKPTGREIPEGAVEIPFEEFVRANFAAKTQGADLGALLKAFTEA